ncbi:MAG: ion transporter [Flavobacteriaceae bacterium]
MDKSSPLKPWQIKLHRIIYEADTPAGKRFDVILLFLIMTSVLVVMLESVARIDAIYGDMLHVAEWIITILFSLEYIARIICIRQSWKYIFSFYGIIDFLSTIPLYLTTIFTGSQTLITLRALRLLRVFRILKLGRFIGESNNFSTALKASKAKITVFISFVLILCVILGTLMYLIEGGAESGFTSIPSSVYWAIVTLTTVGYGDIAPVTALGQSIAALIMILGYGIIAIPTGIVSSEMTKTRQNPVNINTQSCSNCASTSHSDDAEYCNKCGAALHHE